MKNIKSLIKKNGMKKTATELGYSRQYLWMVYTGKAKPSYEFIQKFCDRFNLNPSIFFK
jgi:transcriptional regulator with XRE-family HTH domain